MHIKPNANPLLQFFVCRGHFMSVLITLLVVQATFECLVFYLSAYVLHYFKQLFSAVVVEQSLLYFQAHRDPVLPVLEALPKEAQHV